MDVKAQKFAIIFGPLFLVFFFLSLWGGGYFPPHSPDMDIETLALFYQENTFRIRIGLSFQVLAAAMQALFVSVITVQMLRIGEHVKAYAYGQLAAGSAGMILFFSPPLFWSVAAYRPMRDPELTLVLHDLGWMFFIVPFSLAFIQCLSLALAILSDKRDKPIFEKWVAYLSIWAAIGLAPGPAAMFVKSGPFAWNGIIVFWLPATVLALWYIGMTMALRKAIVRQAIDEAP